MALDLFHPLVRRWFEGRFSAPTDPQERGWPLIAAGCNTLIAAPTGSGKTLAAFLVCLDRLVREFYDGRLGEGIEVVYVSPLKALSNDIERNLQVPLAEIRALGEESGLEPPPIRVALRTGDTPGSQRQAMLRRPPHLLVTTPESLYLLLTSERSRALLGGVKTVIVDEIHALARDKRGSHLSLSLERLEALCDRPPTRIGLSATQKPVDEIARFLVGVGDGAGSDREVSGGNGHATTSLSENRPGNGDRHILLRRTLSTQHSDQPAPQNEPVPDGFRTSSHGEHASARRCEIIDAGHVRSLDLAVEVPPSELAAVCSHEQWDEVYARLCELIGAHRSTLVFVNTRRLAERVSHRLAELLGEDAVASHHGSLSRSIRLSAEQRLKAGRLKAIVATASLELGIDVGYIDLVCQIGSPRSIATFLQRVGRSGHTLGATSKGRLFPLTRDELLECLALVRAVRRGDLDRIEIPRQPLDILAQQIVAEAACQEWDESALYALVKRAWPYRDLSRDDFEAVVRTVSEGITPGSRRGAHVHRDRIGGKLRGRRGARLAAITSGGAIPEVAEFRVVTAEEGTYVGSVDEDFAVESMAGDVFLLGNTSWRIRYVREGQVVVSDAHGAPPTIPFWLGEGLGRTVELSGEVSRLREELAGELAGDIDGGNERLLQCRPEKGTGTLCDAATETHMDSVAASQSEPVPNKGPARAAKRLVDECGADQWAAEQAVRYVALQLAAAEMVPTHEKILFERFFDESGGMQLVIHAPLGSRINRAWGLALRKRFCRSFDFELQAAATDNGIVLSIGPQHSFPIDRLFRMLRTDNARYLLEQAVLAVPMFQVRWRWNVTRALGVLRRERGAKVPFYLQRFRADDLLAAVFPETVGCLENHSGDIQIPDHPLVRQTMHDCLHEAMDVDRWLALVAKIELGEVELVGRDSCEPSPFSHELINANPYAFLDDAPLEERRTRAVSVRRSLSPAELRELGKLDPDAIAQVRQQAWPLVRDAHELHDALTSLVVLRDDESAPWRTWLDELTANGRASRFALPARNGNAGNGARHEAPEDSYWFAAEHWPVIRAAYDGAIADPPILLPAELDAPIERAKAWVELVRGRMAHVGPIGTSRLARQVSLDGGQVSSALEALEGEGVVLRGQFVAESDEASENAPDQQSAGDGAETPSPADDVQWCDRRLLARIHRLTLDGLRRRIQPVEPADFVRFLLAHHGIGVETVPSGPLRLRQTIAQLEGFELPAGAWEHHVLAPRIDDYDPQWLDQLFLSGEVVWGRLRPPRRDESDGPSMAMLTRTVPISLSLRDDLPWLLPPDRADARAANTSNGDERALQLRAGAAQVLEALDRRGALFFQELARVTGLLPGHLEEALRELAALGLVTSDAFAAIRAIVDRRRDVRRRRPGARVHVSARPIGRWSRFPGAVGDGDMDDGSHAGDGSRNGNGASNGRNRNGSQNSVRIESWCRLLLRRYGVVFRDLLARESAAPPWHELVSVLRHMELRGDVRGGRFVSRVGGEQYAVEGVVQQLRNLRDSAEERETASVGDTALVPDSADRRVTIVDRTSTEPSDTACGFALRDTTTSAASSDWVVLSAADPLNLSGIIDEGPRVTATHRNALILCGGRCVASRQAGRIDFHEPLPPETEAEMRRALQLGRRATSTVPE